MLRLLGADASSLVGADAASLVGADALSRIGADAAALRRCGCVARIVATLALLSLPSVHAQTPQPFPQPPPKPAPVRPVPAPPVAQGPVDPNAPTEATLGLPVYPTAQFIASYDAGRGQRYYIFGSTALFAELVTYYRNVLKERGELVFEDPPTHMFEVGRFREDTMAFPPGVTIKDYTWGGGPGYPNPKKDPKPERFPTLIMIVPAPAGQPPGH
jgi:hypothetical protein